MSVKSNESFADDVAIWIERCLGRVNFHMSRAKATDRLRKDCDMFLAEMPDLADYLGTYLEAVYARARLEHDSSRIQQDSHRSVAARYVYAYAVRQDRIDDDNFSEFVIRNTF